MSKQCEFLNGGGDFQCHQIRALPTLRGAAGFKPEEISFKDLKAIACEVEQPEETRAAACPALRSLLASGRKSEFAKPVAINSRP